MTADDTEAGRAGSAPRTPRSRVSEAGVKFSADDVIAIADDPPKSRQLSVAMAIPRRRHWIQSAGTTINRRGAPVRLWIGGGPR